MASVSPTVAVGGAGVVPPGCVPCACRPDGTYPGTGVSLVAGALKIVPVESLKAHCFYFDSITNSQTFDSGSSPKAPPGILQCAWMGDTSNTDRIAPRVTGPNAIRFTSSGARNGWLIVWSRG